MQKQLERIRGGGSHEPAATVSPPRESSPRQPLRQLKFECSEEFYNRLMEEKLQRNLTLQQLAIRALERYFALPESYHRVIDGEAEWNSSAVSAKRRSSCAATD